jgi:hypothetical protein
MTLEMVVIRVVTACTTEDELVAAFARLSGETSLFIPTRTMRTVGLETGFSIRLADGTPKLRGLCVVEGSFADADNAYRRAGVQLGIRKLTPDSEPVFARMRDPMLPLIVTDTVQLSPEEARPTVEMAPLFPEIVDCELTDDPTEAVPTALSEVTARVAADADRTVRVDTPRETILGMPPLVPPRKDTTKMQPIERAALLAPPRMTGRTPVAIIDEDVGRIALPWRPRLRAWFAWLWRKLTATPRRISAPAARRAPQAR